jgi:hypothetical protein
MYVSNNINNNKNERVNLHKIASRYLYFWSLAFHFPICVAGIAGGVVRVFKSIIIRLPNE